MRDQSSIPVRSGEAAAAESPFGWLRHEMDRLFGNAAQPARRKADRKEDGLATSERRYGAFSRQVRLPDVDRVKIPEEMKKGVLTDSMAKDNRIAPRSKKIEIGEA